MNMNISPENKKILIGVLLFGAWFALVYFKVPGADDMIQYIKLSLGGLGVYHVADRMSGSNAPPAPPPTIIIQQPAPDPEQPTPAAPAPEAPTVFRSPNP